MKHNDWKKLTAAAFAVSLSLLVMVPAFAEEDVMVPVENSVESEVQILEENSEQTAVVVAGSEKKTEDQYFAVDAAADAGDEDMEADEVSLDVPQVYAMDSRWTDKRFDPNAKDTIGKTGCTLCCLTAVMSYIDDTFYRPDELCNKMSFSNGAMAWYGEIDSKFKTNQTYSLAAIKEKLLNDEPVIVKSYQRAKNKKGQWYNKAHFVVVTGFKNNGESEADYMIMDPGKRDTGGRTLKSHFSTHPNNKQLYYLKNR